MMMMQAEADKLIALVKESARTDIFVWENSRPQDELFIEKDLNKISFILTLKRDPFEIKLHLRTKDQNLGLMRLDCARFHPNPDGTELRNTPHLHYYIEGAELAWAKPVDWCDISKPAEALDRFLQEMHGIFRGGYQTTLL